MDARRTAPTGARVPTGMDLLRAGVPLTLLLDLGDQEGPDSAELFALETAPDSVWHRPLGRVGPAARLSAAR